MDSKDGNPGNPTWIARYCNLLQLGTFDENASDATAASAGFIFVYKKFEFTVCI